MFALCMGTPEDTMFAWIPTKAEPEARSWMQGCRELTWEVITRSKKKAAGRGRKGGRTN